MSGESGAYPEFDRVAALGLDYGELGTRTACFLPRADASLVASVSHGVVFQMAFWSVYSCRAFKALKDVLREVDPGERLSLIVVDVDGATGFEAMPEWPGPLGGNGETLWVRDGRVTGASSRPDATTLRAKTRDLLAGGGGSALPS